MLNFMEIWMPWTIQWTLCGNGRWWRIWILL